MRSAVARQACAACFPGEALTSPNAQFLPNGTDPNSFRVVTDLGKMVGSKGETVVRVVVDFSGKIWTALPVKAR
jgi:hypothetical protein